MQKNEGSPEPGYPSIFACSGSISKPLFRKIAETMGLCFFKKDKKAPKEVRYVAEVKVEEYPNARGYAPPRNGV